MGQYHKIVNLDKQEVLNPHEFTDGIKLLEFASGGLTNAALDVLLAISNGRGGGDLDSESPLIGSWAGDRIAIIGDYWEKDEAKARNIPTWGETYNLGYKDISRDILKVLCADQFFNDRLLESVSIYGYSRDWSDFFTEEQIKAKRKERGMV